MIKQDLFLIYIAVVILVHPALNLSAQEHSVGDIIELQPPVEKGKYSLEEMLWKRQSVREYKDETPGWEDIGQLLWAAQGINRPDKKGRTAPSAWGAYPLHLNVILPSGVYLYKPENHEVVVIKNKNIWDELSKSGLSRSTVQNAPCVFIFTAEISGMVNSIEILGDMLRYIHQESGHAAQNLLLQAGATGMGGVPIGANIPLAGHKAIGIPANQKCVYILATGYVK